MKINVCIGSACHIKGSYNIIHSFQQLIEEHGLTETTEICAVFCLGHCTQSVSVQLDDGEVYDVSSATVREFFQQHILPTAGKVS